MALMEKNMEDIFGRVIKPSYAAAIEEQTSHKREGLPLIEILHSSAVESLDEEDAKKLEEMDVLAVRKDGTQHLEFLRKIKDVIKERGIDEQDLWVYIIDDDSEMEWWRSYFTSGVADALGIPARNFKLMSETLGKDRAMPSDKLISESIRDFGTSKGRKMENGIIFADLMYTRIGRSGADQSGVTTLEQFHSDLAQKKAA